MNFRLGFVLEEDGLGFRVRGFFWFEIGLTMFTLLVSVLILDRTPTDKFR